MKTIFINLISLLFPIVSVFSQTPIAHWPFDETSGTLAEDVAGNNDGTLVNGPVWINGIQNGALQFDGVNDRVYCGANSGLNMGTGDFTIATWVRLEVNQPLFPTFVAKGGGAAYDAGYWFHLNNKRLKLYLSNGTTRLLVQSDPVEIVGNSWHHVAVVAERAGNATFYVDGEPAGTFDISSFNGDNIQSPKVLSLGSWLTNASSALNGALDETMLYNTALTANDIAALAESDPIARAWWPMNEGSGTTTEDVAGSNEGTLMNGASWTTGIENGALQFDGVDDRVECGDLSGLNMGKKNLTISTWVKMETGQTATPTFLAKGGGASYDAGYWFYFKNNRLKFSVSNGTTRVIAQSGAVSLLDNAWHHLVVVADRAGNASFYVDGQNVGGSNISVLNGANVKTTKSLTLGSWQYSPATTLKGCMDDTRLFDVALDNTEINDLYEMYSEKRATASISENNNALSSGELSTYPNPSKGLVNIKFKVDNDSYITVRVYDQTGREVAQLFEENASTGAYYTREFDATGLPEGMYIVRLQGSDGAKQYSKIIIQK